MYMQKTVLLWLLFVATVMHHCSSQYFETNCFFVDRHFLSPIVFYVLQSSFFNVCWMILTLFSYIKNTIILLQNLFYPLKRVGFNVAKENFIESFLCIWHQMNYLLTVKNLEDPK